MIEIYFTARFRKILQSYSDEYQAAAGRAIDQLQSAFGDPHRHAGLGIRKIGSRHYELRVRLDVRLVFLDRTEGLLFVFAGNHDEVRRFLKAVR